jgi:hypothetical protein
MRSAAGVLAFYAVWFLSSCRTDGGASPGLAARVSVESEKTDTAAIRVYLEGNDGNLVSGALVIVRSGQNASMKLDFDYTGGVYAGDYPLPPDGKLYVEVRSVLLDEPINLNILHKPVTIQPAIQTFQDADGNSALHGQHLQYASKMQIGWNSCGEGIVYQAIIKDAFGVVYSKATEALMIEIPADIIPAGMGYTAQVIAQRIEGDPFFITHNYYSAAVNKGSLMIFNVNE